MNKKGFTMVEMLLVLLVISVLLMVVIPNITSKQKIIHRKGCEAQVEMVNAQIIFYRIDKGFSPSSVSDLISEGYIQEKNIKCADGSSIEINNNGEATNH